MSCKQTRILLMNPNPYLEYSHGIISLIILMTIVVGETRIMVFKGFYRMT